MKLNEQEIREIAHTVATMYCQLENKSDVKSLAKKYAQQYTIAVETLIELNNSAT